MYVQLCTYIFYTNVYKLSFSSRCPCRMEIKLMLDYLKYYLNSETNKTLVFNIVLSLIYSTVYVLTTTANYINTHWAQMLSITCGISLIYVLFQFISIGAARMYAFKNLTFIHSVLWFFICGSVSLSGGMVSSVFTFLVSLIIYSKHPLK